MTEKLKEVTEGKVSDEQGRFRKGRGCVDQIFAMKRLVEDFFFFLYPRIQLKGKRKWK